MKWGYFKYARSGVMVANQQQLKLSREAHLMRQDHVKGILHVKVVPKPTKQRVHTNRTKILREKGAT